MRTTLVLLAAWLACPAFAQTAAGEKVAGGPYVVNVGERSATVMWLVQTNAGTAAPLLHAESIQLTDLRPGTTYYYQSFAGEAGSGSFKTPPSGSAAFQFVVFGDTRTRHAVHRSVIDAIVKYAAPDFIVHTGDLVENGADNSLWPIFLNVERELLRKMAFFPALGNHERNAGNYFDFMHAKPYYSFEWGNAHFTVINSDVGNAASTPAQQDAFWQEQTRWLESDLQSAQKSDFRFLVAHHPPMTAVRRRQGDNAHMTALEPMFEKYRLSAGFFGHDHNYQHYLKNGVHYFVTGGGGAPLYDVDTPPANITLKVESIENFVVVKVDGKKARIQGLKVNGETLDITELGQ
jgi:3',5'-cyclic AMP phosphodiesterase CpdA